MRPRGAVRFWRTAYQIFDNKTRPLLRSEYNRGFHVSADSIEALAKIAWF